jgi:two-component system, cell cycle sensor histidine kinase and response regulator CckA
MKSKLEILLVDDDRVVRGVLARVLRQAGISVVPVEGGAEAIELLRSGRRFDVIVSDSVMPGVSGTALLQYVRRLELAVPVIIVSGNATSQSARVAMDLGSFRYLHKPVETSDLLQAISDAAASRGAP